MANDRLFVITTVGSGAAQTLYASPPVDADLVSVTFGTDAATSSGTTSADVQVNGTSVFATAANVSPSTGSSIASSALKIAADSTTKVASATAKSSVRAGMAGEVTNNVTSGVNFISGVQPADAVLKACKAGDEIKVVTLLGTGPARGHVSLLFVRK